jgi:hypothetical protein
MKRLLLVLCAVLMAACAPSRPPLPPPWDFPDSRAPAAVPSLELPGSPGDELGFGEPAGSLGYEHEVTQPATIEPPTVMPSPQSLGVENLLELGDPKVPARFASLALAQEGRMAYGTAQPVQARQKLQSALQIWGQNPYALYYLGLLEIEAGNYMQAASFARAAISRLRGSPFWLARANLLLAEASLRMGDERAAEIARGKALAIDPQVELR